MSGGGNGQTLPHTILSQTLPQKELTLFRKILVTFILN